MLCFSLLAFFLSHFASSLFSSLCVTGILMCQTLWGREVWLPYCCWCLSMSSSIIALMILDVLPSSYLSVGSIALDTSVLLSHHNFPFLRKKSRKTLVAHTTVQFARFFQREPTYKRLMKVIKKGKIKKTNCPKTKDRQKLHFYVGSIGMDDHKKHTFTNMNSH